VQLALNDSAPSYSALGPLNAIGLALASGSRAISPAVFASLYAIGVSKQILGGQLVWVIMGILGVLIAILVRYFPHEAAVKQEPDAQASSEQTEEQS